MINETYSAFLQGFMPTLARPDVDLLEGLTTAIIVDQERMGANARSTVGTATDANAMLRMVFSRLGQPHVGSPQAFSFNVASAHGAGAITVERGGHQVRAALVRGHRRHVPALRGHGDGERHRPRGPVRRDASRSTKARSPSPATPPTAGTCASSASRASSTRTSRSATTRSASARTSCTRSRPRSRSRRSTSPTRGWSREIQKSFLSKDVEALQPHIRAFVERAVTFTTCPDCGGTRLNEAARSSKIDGVSIADACAMQISDLAAWVRGLEAPSVAPLLAKLRQSLDSFVEIGLGLPRASTARPARCRAARRSGPR